jgi:hypothetical protein
MHIKISIPFQEFRMLLWALPHGALDSAVSLLEHAEALIFSGDQ